MDRRDQILQAILESFLTSAEPVGSKSIVEEFGLDVSAATVRNEMAKLEEAGLIVQPHTSAGRIPTAKGWRFFVDQMLEDRIALQQERSLALFEEARAQYITNKVKERLHDAVSVLSKVTKNVCFATIPENHRTFYVGLSSILQQPEFAMNMASASQVVEVLEQNFLMQLSDLEVGNEVKIFIGEENFLPQIQSCSLLALRYQYLGHEGVIGILGPMRMEYAHNTVLLRRAQRMIEEGQ